MTRTFCDICGDEIYYNGEAERYKIKIRKEVYDSFLNDFIGRRYHWENLLFTEIAGVICVRISEC